MQSDARHKLADRLEAEHRREGHMARSRQFQQARVSQLGLPPPLADEFRTDRIELAAYLMAEGLAVLSWGRDERELVQFAFPGKAECERLAGVYLSYQGAVIPRTYAGCLDWVRRAVHIAR